MTFWFTCSVPEGQQQDACGLPLAAVVQPLPSAPAPPQQAVPAAELARCNSCLAYCNHLCTFQQGGWACSLCGTQNDLTSSLNLRYLRAPSRAALPELSSGAYEALCSLHPPGSAEEEEQQGGGGEGGAAAGVPATPVYLALVDVASGAEFLDLVRTALAGALEALPPSARFGLITFGGQTLGLVEACGPAPVVHRLPLPLGPAAGGSQGAGAGALPQDALPLGALLAEVGSAKESITAAFEALQPEGNSGGEEGGVLRPLGPALRAVLQYLAVAAQQAAAAGPHTLADDSGDTASAPAAAAAAAIQAYAGARLLVFLGGAPNAGAGSVVRDRRPAEAEAAAAAARSASGVLVPLDASFPELSAYAWQDKERPDAAAEAAPTQEGGADADAAAAAAALPDLSAAAPPGVPPAALELDWRAPTFYQEAGAAAAALGACVDVYAAAPSYCGLDMLAQLPSSSGGVLRYYPSLPEAALHQDVYKRLCQPHAFGGLLRLRASPELTVAGCHGRVLRDRQYSDLFHVVGCAPGDAFAFDLHRSSAAMHCTAPVVQLVLQYSQLVPVGEGEQQQEEEEEEEEEEGAAAAGPSFVLQRRMRVATAALPVATSWEELLASVDADAVACVLAHRALGAAAALGARAAQQMLFDWLVLVVAAAAGEGGGQVDASLGAHERLQQLPRLVYALLCSPLLQAPAPGDSPDEAAAARALWRALPPGEVSTAILPRLSSWSSHDALSFPRHSLSRTALQLSGRHIFLLDAFSQLVVYYRASTSPFLPFPPPRTSVLRQAAAAVRQQRVVTPTLRMLREGEGDTSAFDQWLIESSGADPGGAGGEATSFLSFLEGVAQQAVQLLKDAGGAPAG